MPESVRPSHDGSRRREHPRRVIGRARVRATMLRSSEHARHGHLSVIVAQFDSRFCRHEDATRTHGAGNGRLHYWWESARSNALWAARHGYAHRLYCMEEPCEHERAGRLYTAWCKLRALQNAIASRSEGAMAAFVLFLDSDAFWQRAELRLEAFMRQYVPAADWADSPSIFFGCNLPWNGEDRGRRQWNASLINGERGPPNTGVMLLSSTASTREALRSWWASAATTPQWNHKFAWEQSALWELWKRRPDFARRVRVLHDERRGECMRTMDPRHPSPIAHVSGGMQPLERREARLDALGLRLNGSHAWSTCLTRLVSKGGRPTPGCERQRMEVAASGEVTLGACGTC